MSLKFITSFYDIYKEEFEVVKTTPWRVERFCEIARTGVDIGVFVSASRVSLIESLGFPNVKILKTIELMDTWTFQEYYKVSSEKQIELPHIRNIPKDTVEYNLLMHSKIEMMAIAISMNAWGDNSTHYAWMDFNLSHVLHSSSTIPYLKYLSTKQLNENILTIPGCWDKYIINETNNENITEKIHWRFCGGFLLGSSNSFLNFFQLYTSYFGEFMRTYNKLVWEVNFWAWLEAKCSDWKPLWYAADHNDSIICNIPVSTYIYSLQEKRGVSIYKYAYPEVDGFYPCSASYIEKDGRHFLNTRYLNYWITDDSVFLFRGDRTIRSKNIFSELVESENPKLHDRVLFPICYKEFDYNSVNLPEQNMYSLGIEDIRLYDDKGVLKFIGTTVGYWLTGGNRMIIGDYDIDECKYNNAEIIQPPGDTYVEKNWIPIGDDQFIYKWSPLEIGKLVNTENGYRKLEIQTIYTDTQKIVLFNKVRGSTILKEYNGELLGIVHFSEDDKGGCIRKYFHMMVVLEKETYKPLRYSDPFVFNINRNNLELRKGVEFCIGFTVYDNKYLFWISEMDRDPSLVVINLDKIDIKNIF